MKLKKPVRCLINEYLKLLKLIIVMPATNAVSERSFSAMRSLLTYLTSSISENRLNNSMVLHIHKEKLYNISLIDIGNDLVEVNERKKFVLGKFDQSDLRKSSVPTKSVGIQVNIPP